MSEDIKHVITQEDLDINPGLVESGVKVGDEVELPAVETPETPEVGTETPVV